MGEDTGTRGHCVSGKVNAEGLPEIAEVTLFQVWFSLRWVAA